MERDEPIRQLFEKYISGNYTEDELDQLLSCLDDTDGDAELRRLIYGEIQRDDQTEDDDLINAITQNAEQRIFARTRTKPFYRTAFFRIAVAAALLIGVAILLIISDRKKRVEAVTDANISLAAGTERAILSLSDGRKVELGTAGNSEWADESGSTITQRNGEIIYGANTSENNASNQLEVPKGGQYAVTISDGSRIWLNAGSKLIYPVTFTGKKRREIQLYGEAYFEVAKDKAKPFIVRTERQTIEVLGTHFNINSYTDEPETITTLTEGSIRLIGAADKKQAFILRPGEMAATSKDHTTVGRADIESALAWQKGIFYFRNAPLSEILRQVSRWYDIEIDYRGQIQKRSFSCSVDRNADLSELLKILMLNDIHFTLVDNQKNRKLIVEP